jgi:protein ImuB
LNWNGASAAVQTVSEARQRHELTDTPPLGPFALTHWSGNSDHLHCLNTEASAKGLRYGMALTVAREVAAPASLRR